MNNSFFDISGCDYLDGKSILVTGGTGSFGRQLVHFVLNHSNCRRLIVLSRDELKQFEMETNFRDHPRVGCLRFFLGDVRDYDRLVTALHDVDYVIHAAAQKQVVASEYNPMECMKTNVMGADNLVRAAIANNVRRVIALSTDKAVNPINLYGASKLASDKIFIAANNVSAGGQTRFSVVRYGNVIGSRGSVIPQFKKALEDKKDRLPITDPRMTRFWISLDQAVSLVLGSLKDIIGGEIIVPKLPSFRIADLAGVIAPGLVQDVIGIRPGEKLHEIMLTEDDARSALDLGDRFVVKPQFAYWGTEATDGRAWPKGKRLPEGFEYRSDTNEALLTGGALKQFCRDVLED